MPPCRECRILYWPSSILILPLTPAGSLITGASAGLPCGNVVAGTEGRNSEDSAERLDFLFVPALDDAGDGPVVFGHEQGGDAGQAEGIARREAVLVAVEQGREGDSEALVELA